MYIVFSKILGSIILSTDIRTLSLLTSSSLTLLLFPVGCTVRPIYRQHFLYHRKFESVCLYSAQLGQTVRLLLSEYVFPVHRSPSLASAFEITNLPLCPHPLLLSPQLSEKGLHLSTSHASCQGLTSSSSMCSASPLQNLQLCQSRFSSLIQGHPYDQILNIGPLCFARTDTPQMFRFFLLEYFPNFSNRIGLFNSSLDLQSS